MTRGLLVCVVLSLGRCTHSFAALSRVPSAPSAKPPLRRDAPGSERVSRSIASPPWLRIRGGDGESAAAVGGSTTSLKSSVLGAVDVFYKTMPLASAFLTCGVKASLADMVAQKRAAKEVVQQADGYTENDSIILNELGETPFERRRNLAFFLYGALYQGE